MCSGCENTCAWSGVFSLVRDGYVLKEDEQGENGIWKLCNFRTAGITTGLVDGTCDDGGQDSSNTETAPDHWRINQLSLIDTDLVRYV